TASLSFGGRDRPEPREARRLARLEHDFRAVGGRIVTGYVRRGPASALRMADRADGLREPVLFAPVPLGPEDGDESGIALRAERLEHAVLLAEGSLGRRPREGAAGGFRCLRPRRFRRLGDGRLFAAGRADEGKNRDDSKPR